MYTSRIILSSRRATRVPLTGFTSRAIHATTRVSLAAKTTRQAPDSARAPKEDTLLEQNPHLKHAASSKGGNLGRDQGKGNAAPNPELPSRRKVEPVSGTASGATKGDRVSNEKRKIHTSAVQRTQGDSASGSSGHTADSYFKEVDENPPASDKVHRVDGTNDEMHRPNQQWSDPKKEYATVSKDEPYEPPVETNDGEKPEQKSQKLRYGGTKRDSSRNAPAGDEGPQGKDAGGLKPNGSVAA